MDVKAKEKENVRVHVKERVKEGIKTRNRKRSERGKGESAQGRRDQINMKRRGK